jgi:hypothetical protein
MKVVCIDNGWCNLTIGKTYEVIRVYPSNYVIMNDIDLDGAYRKELFKPLAEIRNEKINKLLK